MASLQSKSRDGQRDSDRFGSGKYCYTELLGRDVKAFGFTTSPSNSGMLWSNTMQYFSPSTDAIIANNNTFVYSLDFFIPAGQQDIPQATEFDLNVNRARNGTFIFATQCDYQGGVGTGAQRFKWDIWTFATSPGGS
jgi:hypothetical protein